MAGSASALRLLALASLCVPGSVLAAYGQALELRLTTRGGAADEVIHLGSTTALKLLGSAGIEASWRDCSASACPDEPGQLVLIHLLPVVKTHKRAVSGEFLRDGRTRAATVLVYLPRLAAVTDEIRRLPESRTNPVLLKLEVGHLVGLTIAHEVGHSLGLAHADLGVMAARPSVREVRDLRMSRLAFDVRESSRMRLALSYDAAVLAAVRD